MVSSKRSVIVKAAWRYMGIRKGFTRCDLLLSLLTLAALLALLAPTACGFQESSRRASCADNLRVLGRSCRRFADANNGYLPNNQQSPYSSWNTQILPFHGEEGLHSKYRAEQDWWDDEHSNNRALGAEHVAAFQCPSAPGGDRTIAHQDNEGDVFQLAPTDYVGSAGAYVHSNAVENLFRGAMAFPGRYYGASNVTARRAVKLGEIIDGASQTLLVVEMAGKPNVWRHGMLAVDKRNPQTPELFNPGISAGNWSAPNWNHLRSYDVSGVEPFGPCGVNCSNAASIYGFHPNGANVVMVDGSVRHLGAGLPEEILVALTSVAASEILAATDYEAVSPE